PARCRSRSRSTCTRGSDPTRRNAPPRSSGNDRHQRASLAQRIPPKGVVGATTPFAATATAAVSAAAAAQACADRRRLAGWADGGAGVPVAGGRTVRLDDRRLLLRGGAPLVRAIESRQFDAARPRAGLLRPAANGADPGRRGARGQGRAASADDGRGPG